MTGGERLLHDALVRITLRLLLVGPLRTFVIEGAPSVESKITAETAAMLTELLTDEEVLEWMGTGGPVPKQAIDSMASASASQRAAAARQAVDAADLVFYQALADAAATDCCKALALLDRNTCLEYAREEQFKIEDLREKGVEWIEDKALERWLARLGRRPLVERIDLIYAICRPADSTSRLAGYTYDRDRLKRVDNLRHEVVHGSGLAAVASLGEADVGFLMQTGQHLIYLVMKSFGITLNSAYTSARMREK